MRQQLSEAIDDFARYRASDGLARNTLANDASTLRTFLAANGNIWCHQITQEHAIRWRELSSKTRKASSQAPAFATVSKFFAWARHTKRMPTDNDPLFGMRRPKPAKRERQRVHVSKFPALLDEASERTEWHRALVAVLLYTLLRGSEVADLRIRDLDLDAGYLTARIHKSNLEDRVPICAELDIELRAWLTAYTTLVGPLKPHYYLVPARSTQPVFGEDTRKIVGANGRLLPEKQLGAVARLVTPILAGVGIDVTEKGEGGHTIRRSGARALFDALSEAHHPRPLRVVKDLLHHSSEQTTETYIGCQADRLDRDSVLRGAKMYGETAKVVHIREAN